MFPTPIGVRAKGRDYPRR